MITENGIVTSADTNTAWIKTVRAGACESCSSRKSCGTAHSQNELMVSVKNTLSVRTGDHVVIGIETKPMLYLTFLLYVFPILMMIAGALIGENLPGFLNLNPSAASMVIGFTFFGLSFYYIRKKNKTLSKEDAYKPFLIRKKPQTVPGGCTLT